MVHGEIVSRWSALANDLELLLLAEPPNRCVSRFNSEILCPRFAKGGQIYFLLERVGQFPRSKWWKFRH